VGVVNFQCATASYACYNRFLLRTWVNTRWIYDRGLNQGVCIENGELDVVNIYCLLRDPIR
jgi:hypothetical protein